MLKQVSLYAMLWAGLCAAGNASAENTSAREEFKCWKNEAGVMECGNTVPPQFVSQGYEILNQNATVVEVEKREMSAEERNRLLEAERQRVEAEKQAKVQAEEDKRLLDLYPTDRDITNARDLKILRINKSIEITQKDLISRKLRLDKLREQAERSAKRTDKVSQENLKTLQSHIQSLEGQIETIQMSINGKEHEKQDITAEYAKTLAKYAEIQKRATLIQRDLKEEARLKAQTRPVPVK